MGGGYSHFFFIRRLGPSIYRTPPPQKKKKKKKKQQQTNKQKNRNFKNPPKIFEIIAPPPPKKKNTPFCTLTLKKTQKCIETTPKYSLILWWSPKNIHKIFIPKKYSFFWKPEKKWTSTFWTKKNYPRLRMYENIRVLPPPPPPHLSRATVCKNMTPNIIIYSIFDEVSDAIKKKSCGKITTVSGPTG